MRGDGMIIDKPWGYERIWAKTDKYVAKILHIKAGHKLSLQKHEIKEETILVNEGRLHLVYHNDGKEIKSILSPGDTFHVKPGTVHRFCAGKDDGPVTLIEVSTTEIDDVIRLEDDYDRK